MRRGVRECVGPFEAIEDMGSASEDLQRHVSSIAWRKLMEEIFTCASPIIVVILAANENTDFRVNECSEIRLGHVI